MATPALVILAAGMGSRYGGLKQIEPVGPGGEVVLDYSVFDAQRAGFTDVVFVIRRDIEAAFREQVGRRFEPRLNIRYVFQESGRLPGGHRSPPGRTKPWGTGHALWCASEALAQPFAVINADDFYGSDSFRRLGQFLGAPAAEAVAPAVRGCMVGFKLARTLSEFGTVSRGICQADAAGRLGTVEECPAIGRKAGKILHEGTGGAAREFTGNEIVSMNCWGFSPGVFPFLEKHLVAFLDAKGTDPKAEFYLPSAVAAMIRRGEATVDVLSTEADWFGVTYREDHPQVVAALRRLIAAGVYPEKLWA